MGEIIIRIFLCVDGETMFLRGKLKPNLRDGILYEYLMLCVWAMMMFCITTTIIIIISINKHLP